MIYKGETNIIQLENVNRSMDRYSQGWGRFKHITPGLKEELNPAKRTLKMHFTACTNFGSNWQNTSFKQVPNPNHGMLPIMTTILYS